MIGLWKLSLFICGFNCIVAAQAGIRSELSHQKYEKSQNHNYADDPPNPMHTARHRALAAKLALYKVVVIEFLLRQIQAVGISLLRPTGLFVRATFRTDRKSTRLNSSHGYISYAVFCL